MFHSIYKYDQMVKEIIHAVLTSELEQILDIQVKQSKFTGTFLSASFICNTGKGMDFNIAKFVFDFDNLEWSSIKLESKEIIERFYNVQVPSIVFAILHELGHFIDYQYNVTREITNEKLATMQHEYRMHVYKMKHDRHKAVFLYRASPVEKFADLYACHVWMTKGKCIIDILEKYAQEGLYHMFD